MWRYWAWRVLRRCGNGEPARDPAVAAVDDQRLRRRSVQGEQREMPANRLYGVAFGPGRAREIPNDRFVRPELARARHPRKEQMPVREHRGVVELLRAARRGMQGDPRPAVHPAPAHDEQRLAIGFAGVPFASVDEVVLREAPPGENGRRERVGGLGGPKERGCGNEQGDQLQEYTHGVIKRLGFERWTANLDRCGRPTRIRAPGRPNNGGAALTVTEWLPQTARRSLFTAARSWR